MAKRKRRSSKGVSPYHSTIEQHHRKGSKLIPPLANIEKMKPSSWMNDRLPEMLWAGLLFTQLPRELVIEKIHEVANFIHRFSETDNPPFNLSLSGFNTFPREQQEELFAILLQREEFRNALSPLMLFDNLPAKEVWNSYLENQHHDWQPIMVAVANMLDHQSQVSTDCRWVRVVSVIAAGKLMLPSKEMIEKIAYYPNRGDLREVRPSIRATEIALGDLLNIENSDWPSLFWVECLEKTSCFPLVMKPETSLISGTNNDQINLVYTRLLQHCSNTRVTTTVDARHETAFGIAFYSLSLLRELTRLNGSQYISSQLALRTLVECYITLAYLVKKDEKEIWLSYRVFGAGQAKLAYLKLEASDRYPSYVNMNTLEVLANEDMWEEYLTIELGHWDKANLRKLSEEAGVKDIYDRFYSWTSSYTHGHWGAVRDAVYSTCGNPLHRLHRIPMNEPRLLPDVLPDACQIMDLILQLVSACYPGFDNRVTLNLEEIKLETNNE